MPVCKRMTCVALLLFAPIASAQIPSRPNILLLMAEDMSARVATFGDSIAVTPNLDALAAQSVRYTNTFTAAGVCAPSRAAHILGMHPISTGTQHMRSSSRPEGSYYSVPPENAKAYPELLRSAGYYTYTDHKLDYQFSTPFANSGPTTIWNLEGAAVPDWSQRAQGQPFFGFINFPVTHESGVFSPLVNRPKSAIHFLMQVMRWYSQDEPVPKRVNPQDIVVPPYYPDTKTVRTDMARHYDNIAEMDAEVGTILKQLEAAGLADSTIVIWTTDHGDGLPRGKRELFDSGIKVPMIIRWPEAFRPEGVKPGAVDERLISFIDLAPTILSLAGVSVPATMQGHDFSAPDAAPNQYIYASRDRIDELMDRQRAVRDNRYKYIRSWYPEVSGGTDLTFRDNIDMVREMRAMYDAGQLSAAQRQWYQPPGKERLFDLELDPFEIHNVSDEPLYRGVLQRMRGEMDAWLARAGDWSEESESAMVARFESGGERQVTPAPTLSLEEGTLIITPAAGGHSLEYRVDDGQWQLYIESVSVNRNSEIEARAVRYGWKESNSVSGP